MYKDELQKKNIKTLESKLQAEKIPQFIQRFFIDRQSGATKLSYWTTIRDFLNWCIAEKIINKTILSDIEPSDMGAIETEDITLYLRHKRENGMSLHSIHTKRNILSSFWEYMKRTRRVPDVRSNVVLHSSEKGLTYGNIIAKKLPKDEDIEKMMDRIHWKQDEIVRERNLAVMNLLKGTGLREIELAGLDMKDLDLSSDIPSIKVLGKGGYSEEQKRTVYLTQGALDGILKWLSVRKKMDNIVDSDAVFINRNGKRMNTENIKAIFRNYSRGDITPHMMRHWYATVMTPILGITFVQQQLGHRSMNTTINVYADGSYQAREILKSM